MSCKNAKNNESLIHRLINRLLKVIQTENMEKSEWAAKCLAEIGPSDLGTAVLKSDSDSVVYKIVRNNEFVV